MFKRGTFIKTMHWLGLVDTPRFKKFFGDLYTIENHQLMIYNIGTKQWLHVPVGSWIIKMRNGDFVVIADETMRMYAKFTS
jgi:hypothetical protein